MKFIIYILVLLFFNEFYSQGKVIDSSNIAFKAKLLTLSRIGVADSTSVINDVLSQDVHFIPNRSKNIVLLKIKFDQKFYIETNISKGWFGSCNFYLAYNKITKKFYRLGGFDTEDVDDFFNDLNSSTYYNKSDADFLIAKDFSEVIYGEINITCLEMYHKTKPKQRAKKGFTCFEKCSEVIYTQFTTHKGFD